MQSRGHAGAGSGVPGVVMVGLLVLLGGRTLAQTLSFHDYRERERPEYATIMLGPFYSDIVLNQSTGWRWSRSTGAGLSVTDEYDQGQILKNGSDFPIITTLSFNNYLLLPKADVEFNIRVQYNYYPLNTQEDELSVDFSDEGIFGGLSSEIRLTPVLRMRLYEQFAYYTDWIDVRGSSDPYGGRRYERIRNNIGMDLNWLASKLDSVNLSLGRQDEIPVGNSDEQFDLQENHAYTQSLSWQHRQTAYFIWRLGANQSQAFFTHPERDETIYNWRLYWGVDLRLTEHIRIDSSIGYNATRIDGETTSSSSTASGGTFSFGSTIPITERVSHTLSASRRLTTAFQGGAQVSDAARYQIDWTRMFIPGTVYIGYRSSSPTVDSVWGKYVDIALGTNLTIPLTERISSSLSSSYTTRRNTEGALEPEEGELIDPTTLSDYATWVTTLSTGIRILKKVSLSGYVQHIERFSDDESIEYTRDIVGLNMNWAHRF